MEKRLKYLLGFLIVGIGLFFNNTFGLVVEGVTIPAGIEMSYVDFYNSSNYKYSFEYSIGSWGYASPRPRFFGYKTYYNGNTQFDYSFYNVNRPCPSLYSTIQLNSSITNRSLYTGECKYGGSAYNQYQSENMPRLGFSESFDSTQRVRLGAGVNFGDAFVFVGTPTSPDPSPKYGFGGGFFSNDNQVSVTEFDLGFSPLRLYYYRNGNSISPLDGFDVATNSGSNISSFFSWQYYTPNGTRFSVANRNAVENFGDLGQSYQKGLHIGGYGFGYSFAIRKSLSKTMTWNDFDFATVGSKCLQTLYIDGSSDSNSQTSQGCQQIGMMALKGNSYVTYENNQPVIVLAKDLEDHTRILYEKFDCYEDDIQRIFNDQYCTSLGHGYLSISGNMAILPFSGSSSDYTVSSSGNGILDFFVGNLSYGSITHLSNGFIIKSSDNDGHDFNIQFDFNPYLNSTSIKDYYLFGLLGYTGTANNSGVPNEGSNPSNSNSLYYNCLGPVYNTPDGNPPAYCYNENGVFDPDRLKNCYTTFEQISSGGILHYYCNTDGYYQEIVFEQYGSGYAIVPGENNTNILDILENPGYTEEYFKTFTNKKGFFFKCPFPYDSNLIIWPKLISMLNGVDIALPINCILAGYSNGMNFISSQFNLHFIDNGPLFSSDSDNALMVYRFVDFILVFGCLFMLIKVFKLFK